MASSFPDDREPLASTLVSGPAAHDVLATSRNATFGRLMTAADAAAFARSNSRAHRRFATVADRTRIAEVRREHTKSAFVTAVGKVVRGPGKPCRTRGCVEDWVDRPLHLYGPTLWEQMKEAYDTLVRGRQPTLQAFYMGGHSRRQRSRVASPIGEHRITLAAYRQMRAAIIDRALMDSLMHYLVSPAIRARTNYPWETTSREARILRDYGRLAPQAKPNGRGALLLSVVMRHIPETSFERLDDLDEFGFEDADDGGGGDGSAAAASS